MPQDHQQQTTFIDLQQENQRLKLLQRIALIVAKDRNRSTLLHAALVELHQFFSVDGGGVHQFDHIDSPRNLTANLGISDELIRDLQKIPVGKGLTEQVIRNGAPCSWIDLRCEPQLYCRAVLDSGWRSLISLPLQTDERMAGILFLFQRIPRQFSKEDTDLLKQVCQILANAVLTADRLEKLEWQQQRAEAGQRELERSRSQLRAHLYRLEESNLSLEQTNLSKTRFLGVASHELRTPLTCILSATELLQMKLSNAPGETLAVLKTLEQGGLRLQALIEDLLELARIESRDLYLASEPLDLSRILTELQLALQMKATEKKISLSLGPLPLKLSLHGDNHHLRRALTRLLDNALKYTPADGQIHIKTRHQPGSELNQNRQLLEKFCPDFFLSTPVENYVLVQITDNGTGITKEEQLHIFDKFHSTTTIKHHGRSSETGNTSGAGLGLPLAKGIIDAHGGMIWVDSSGAPSAGSTFNVLLPLRAHRPATENS